MKNKKLSNKSANTVSPKKLRIVMIFVAVVFIALTVRILYIEFFQRVNGSSLKEIAYKQQTVNRIISPKRGTIYDATGKALAISAQVDTVSINPTLIKDTNKEKIAMALSSIFELDYTEIFNKVNSDSSVETIAKKVEKSKIDALQSWMKTNKIYSGINIDADSKRYYPYGNLASNLIGFCGTDNQGLWGVEVYWDSTLTGTPGKVVTSTDAVSQEIPESSTQNIPAENGSNLILSIDATIQSVVEKYLKEAVEKYSCSRGGNAIVMNPNTGDVLAIATYPDYNLNSPFEPTTNLVSNWDTLTPEEKTTALNKMWKNRAITDMYEPGSVFKLITASVALEENITDTDVQNDFTCIGYETIAGTNIHCWSSVPHGKQTLREALMHSCNPSFMQLGARIGATLLYKYYDAFGLFNKTGIATSGEVGGNFHDLDNVHAQELATMSFGQRITITPLQMATAICAIANDGVLMQPRIVKQVVNADTGAITNIDSVTVRQVLSKETSDKMKSLMESVVLEGTGKNGAVKGYSIGGKTGTSEPDPGKPEEGYVASYVAVAPISDPQLVVLVTLYDPSGYSYQGSQIAGPTVSKILTEILPYLEIPSYDSTITTTPTANLEYITVPDVTNKTVVEAQSILQSAGFKYSISINGDKNSLVVTDQFPAKDTVLLKNSIVAIYTNENTVRTSVTVPNLTDMTQAQAINALRTKSLNISIEGNGNVVSQSPSYDTSVEIGTIITVKFE